MKWDLPAKFLHWLSERQANRVHRQLLIINGSINWARNTLHQLLQHLDGNCIAVVGNDLNIANAQSVTNKNYRQFLGCEFDHLIYDGFEGTRANALVALSGTVKSQGLMILLCPTFDVWPDYDDPETEQRTSYGFKRDRSHFISWLVGNIAQHSTVATLSDDDFVGEIAKLERPETDYHHEIFVSEQQKVAVDGILNVLRGHRNRPLVITADRGRGKSSSLGIAAGLLALGNERKTILVTAPRFSAVEQIFNHAIGVCPALRYETKQKLVSDNLVISFEAFDALIEYHPQGDLLFIDEAAALPNEVLSRLVNQYSRVVFSTTVHGYEGSGRGFELRFKGYLQENFPGWKSLHIDQPVRWFQGDCLEQFWFDVMQMKPRHDLRATTTPTSFEKVSFKLLSRETLCDSPQLLNKAFQMLVNAHYQTEPDDLVRLLDGRELQLMGGFIDDVLLCVVILAEEGGEKLQALSQDISEGKRRLQGHLLAQNLAYNRATPAYATLSYLRIVRIAVAPEYQFQGLGSKTLSAVKKHARAQNIDFLGTSFGLTPSLLAFWQKNGFKPAKIGFKKDPASGEYNILMLNPLTEDGDKNLLVISEYFQHELHFQINRRFKSLPPQLILQLMAKGSMDKGSAINNLLTAQEKLMLRQFCLSNRPLHTCETALFSLTVMFANCATITPGRALDCDLMIACIMQNRNMKYLTETFGISGKKQLEHRVREGAKSMLSILDNTIIE